MARITSQATSVEVPPPNGAKLNVDEMAVCVTDDIVETDSFIQLINGIWDRGLVIATTTKIRTR